MEHVLIVTIRINNIDLDERAVKEFWQSFLLDKKIVHDSIKEIVDMGES